MIALQWLEDGRARASGELPAGAARAVVVGPAGAEHPARTHAGRWEVELHHPPGFDGPFVRYEDDANAIVRAPVPNGAPVADADTPCPACGASRWSATAELVACDVCGHHLELPAGAPPDWRTSAPAPGRAADGEPAPRPSEIDRGYRIPPDEFATARIPFFAPSGGPLYVSGRGGPPGRLASVTVGDRTVRVTTEDGGVPAPADAARQLLVGALPQPDGLPAGRTMPAAVLLIAEIARAQSAGALEAALGERTVLVDGRPVRFTTATASGVTGAVAAVDGASVAILAPDAAFPATLRRLAAIDVA